MWYCKSGFAELPGNNKQVKLLVDGSFVWTYKWMNEWARMAICMYDSGNI